MKISESSIKPQRFCKGICQNDSGICGHFEGMALDGDEPCAACSREDEDS